MSRRRARLCAMQAAGPIRVSADDALSLLASAETDWQRPVPHCPEWDAAGLVRHTGGILLWMAAILTSRERVERRTLGCAPEDLADLPAWYLANLDRLLNVFESADPESATWTFSSSGDRRVKWWARRFSVEFAVHRWDVEYAVAATGGSSPRPLDGDVAAEGIEEFVVEFLPGLLAREGVTGISGTLHLAAIDAPTQWWIDLDAGGTSILEPVQSDTTVRGTRSDVLLWLVNRGISDSLVVRDGREIVDLWGQLRR